MIKSCYVFGDANSGIGGIKADVALSIIKDKEERKVRKEVEKLFVGRQLCSLFKFGFVSSRQGEALLAFLVCFTDKKHMENMGDEERDAYMEKMADCLYVALVDLLLVDEEKAREAVDAFRERGRLKKTEWLNDDEDDCDYEGELLFELMEANQILNNACPYFEVSGTTKVMKKAIVSEDDFARVSLEWAEGTRSQRECLFSNAKGKQEAYDVFLRLDFMEIGKKFADVCREMLDLAKINAYLREPSVLLLEGCRQQLDNARRLSSLIEDKLPADCITFYTDFSTNPRSLGVRATVRLDNCERQLIDYLDTKAIHVAEACFAFFGLPVDNWDTVIDEDFFGFSNRKDIDSIKVPDGLFFSSEDKDEAYVYIRFWHRIPYGEMADIANVEAQNKKVNGILRAFTLLSPSSSDEDE